MLTNQELMERLNSLNSDIKQGLSNKLHEVENRIDSLSKKQLSRILKRVSQTDFFLSMEKGNEQPNLSEQEQQLVDNIFNLQGEIIGLIQLTNELGNKED